MASLTDAELYDQVRLRYVLMQQECKKLQAMVKSMEETHKLELIHRDMQVRCLQQKVSTLEKSLQEETKKNNELQFLYKHARQQVRQLTQQQSCKQVLKNSTSNPTLIDAFNIYPSMDQPTDQQQRLDALVRNLQTAEW
jgi:hypothetical protein